MAKTSLLDIYRYEKEKSVFVGVRLSYDTVLKIDELSSNRSEFIRKAIEFYIQFQEISNDLLKLLKKLGFET